MKIALSIVALASSVAPAAPKLSIEADVQQIERGRIAHVTVTATGDDGKPLVGRHVVPYVNGVRFGGVGVTDDAGRATVGVPAKDAEANRIVVDLVPPFAERGERKYYLNLQPVDASSASLSNEVTITATPPAPKGTLPAPTWDVMADTWVATDGLGRALPTFEDVGGPRANKTVGLFYYIWLEHFGRNVAGRERPVVRDTTKTIAQNPDAPKFTGDYYWWAEPLFGYYNSGDPYVLAKHAQMLGDAGVDVLINDTTNNLGYLEQWLVQAESLRSIRESGQPAPQVAHLCWASTAGGVMDALVRDFYDAGITRDLWFEWKGRPLLLARAEKIPADSPVRDRFALRTSWAWTTDPKGWFGDGEDKWPWMAEVPAKFGWHEDPNKPEQIAVTAGHHASTNKGKSFLNGRQPPRDKERSGEGIQFAEQWEHALKVDPEFVLVTQWNEWIAGAFAQKDDKGKFLTKPQKKGDLYFVDEYDGEFSRDTEPTKGGYGDNYYYQLVANVRRYKGVRPIPKVAPRPVAIDGRFDDWTGVAPEFRDTLGDPTRRDYWNYGWLERYVNTTGRNDIRAAKVSFDADAVQFYVATTDALSPTAGDDWMTLYVDADRNARTGWMGYDLRVRPGTGTIEANVGGRDAWAKSDAAASVRHTGRELELSLPRRLIAGDAFDFKWADHCHDRGDWTDFTLNGDAAPNDRFNYRALLR